MATVDDAFAYVQSLSLADQQILAERILEALPQQEFTPPASHLAEVERRWAEYEAGRMQAIPWEQVRDEIRRMLPTHE